MCDTVDPLAGSYYVEALTTAVEEHARAYLARIQAMSAVLGGTQSLHTNSMDEALGLPTEGAAILALRTQQVIAHETGVCDTVDPLAGSNFVESLTDAIERAARDYLDRIDAQGGAVAAIEKGFQQREIHEAAYRWQKQVESEEVVVVGVNRFVSGQRERPPVLRVDPALERARSERLAAPRASRGARVVDGALRAVEEAAPRLRR